ncbi:hypothetical protein E0L36_26700 [Streptomyces sp. AJS327]|uniref:recombination directionality factor n=1 Tax=Streptomyces sp. AJS327 TaxID=2545265 RepID=UPI0015DF8C5D|nr:hypothetical protein [Streptomyces sp. AJS327]MBA0054310.1 hypothetical protein [Streptomyces sp. AJS327]
MARTLRILDADPESRPKVHSSDFVGRFRAGMQLNNRPVSLSEWRITTGDPEVAKAVSELFGGTPEEWETTKEDGLQILTDRDSVKVVVDGPDSVTFRMALYGMQGKPTHACDGVEFIDSDDPRFGQPCGCPTALAERKAAAKAGYGPKPDQRITFRLADDPELGKFRLMTGSWEFMKSIERVWSDLEAVGGPALCTLKLELVEFTTKSGIAVSYRKPVLQVHGRVPEDVDAVLPSLSKVVQDDDLPF